MCTWWSRGARLVLVCLIVVHRPANAEEKPKAAQPKPFAVKVTGSGRSMILIPGLTCGGNVWDGTVDHFKDRFQCHVVTLAGFAGQPAIGEPVLPRARDALIQYVRDQKLDRPVIVGHSLGGALAFWIAATAPSDVGPIVAVDGVPYFPGMHDPNATPDSMRKSADEMRDNFRAQTAEQFALQNRFFLSSMVTDPKDLDKVAALSEKSDPQAVGQVFYELMTTDLRPLVKAIRSPVLLLGSTALAPDGDVKKKIEAAFRAQVAPIPNHKVVFAQKARHFIQLDEPKFFFDEVESFLKTAEPARAE